MTDNKFGFGAVKEKITAMKEELPIKLAFQAENFFESSWRNQAWDGKPWKEVQRRIPGTKAFLRARPAARTRAILIGSGDLKRKVSNSIRTQTFNQIRLVVDLPYAKAQNDGNEHLDARPFMKDSAILKVKQQELIKGFIDKIWK